MFPPTLAIPNMRFLITATLRVPNLLQFARIWWSLRRGRFRMGTACAHAPLAATPARLTGGRAITTHKTKQNKARYVAVVFRRGYIRRGLQEPARQADVLSSTAATKELVQGKAVLPSKEADSEPGGLGIGL